MSKGRKAQQAAAPAPDPEATSADVTTEPGGNAAAQERLRAQAVGLKERADTFRTTTLDAFQMGLDCLDPAMVDSAGDAIVSEWGGIESERDSLDAELVWTSFFRPMLLADADGEPTDPASSPEVLLAKRATEQAEYAVGVQVNLQQLEGAAVLGSFRHYDTPDVAAYVLQEVARAKRVLGVAHQIATILENPELTDNPFLDEPTTSSAQDRRVVALGLQVETHIEQLFMESALGLRGVRKAYQQIHRDSKHLRHHGEDLQEEAFVTRDQRLDLDPALIDRMQRDADTIESEVKSRLYASDSEINDCLSHYTTPEELDAFFAILDRRALIDAMLSRGDTSYVKEKLRASKKYTGRRYNASLDIGKAFAITENADDIVSEMGKQTPGAICKMASGVFKGMSHIPVIGGTMDDASKAFDDLAEYADEKTGASDIGRKWRNGIAKGTGIVVSGMMQGGAGAEMAAARGVQVANAGARAYDAYQDVDAIVDEVKALKDVYDSGKVFWGTVVKSLDEVPVLLGDLSSGDWIGAVTQVDKICDNLVGQVGGAIKGKVTLEGKKGDLKELDEKAGRAKHQAALAKFALVSERLGTKDPDEVTGAEMIELRAAGAEVQSAAKERYEGRQETVLKPTKPTTVASIAQSAETALREQLKGILVDLFVQGVNYLRKLLKDAILQSLQETRQQDPEDPEDPKKDDKLGDRPGWKAAFARIVIDGAAGLGPTLVTEAISALKGFATDVLTRLVMMLVKKKWPDFGEAAEPAAKKGLDWLVDYAEQELEPAKFLEKPVSGALKELATAVMSGYGFQAPAPAK